MSSPGASRRGIMYTLTSVSRIDEVRVRASDRAYSTLLDEIQRGILPPGEPCSAKSSRRSASESVAHRCARRSAASPPTGSSRSSRRASPSSPMSMRATSASSSRCAARWRRPPPGSPPSGGMPRPSPLLADEFARAQPRRPGRARRVLRRSSRDSTRAGRVRRQRLPHRGAAHRPHPSRAGAPARARQPRPARGIRRRAPPDRLGHRRARRRPRPPTRPTCTCTTRSPTSSRPSRASSRRARRPTAHEGAA